MTHMENTVATRKPKADAPQIPVTTEVVVVAPKPKIGRPSKYTPELADEICQRLSNGEPLRQICRDDHMPAWQKIYEWMAKDEKLSGAIAHARDLGYDAMAEECLIIADTPQLGQTQVMDDKGSKVTIEDMLGHRKLKIETRLKLLAKFNPKKYGERVQIAGSKEEPFEVNAKIEAVSLFDGLMQNLELTKQVKISG